jgi:uncharacterized membrane protein (DUF4010 family)
VALGGGLLIGLDRERRKGRGADREAAGIRSFTLAAVGGALARMVDETLVVAVGALVVLVLVGVAYYKSRVVDRATDPGLTTELALFVTYLVGVLAVDEPAFGAGAAVVVAVLLASRERLHRFATRALSDAEVHDALLLAALTLVILPLLPAAPLPWLADLKPRTLVLVMVLILALQATGHVALRLLGARAGLALSGLLSGFVSSTATVASMGARARHDPAHGPACEAGAMLSTAATWIQSLLLLAVLSPPAAASLAPVALAGAAVAAGSGVLRARTQRAAGRVDDGPAARHGPLRVREAATVAVLLAGVSLVVGWAQRAFGEVGVVVSAAIAALADAQSPVPLLGALQASGQISTGTVLTGTLVAVTANSVTRTIAALVAGGAGYGARIGASLAASTGAAWVAALWMR